MSALAQLRDEALGQVLIQFVARRRKNTIICTRNRSKLVDIIAAEKRQQLRAPRNPSRKREALVKLVVI